MHIAVFCAHIVPQTSPNTLNISYAHSKSTSNPLNDNKETLTINNAPRITTTIIAPTINATMTIIKTATPSLNTSPITSLATIQTATPQTNKTITATTHIATTKIVIIIKTTPLIARRIQTNNSNNTPINNNTNNTTITKTTIPINNPFA